MHCGKQHAWHSTDRQLPHFDMFLHLMSLNMHRVCCRGCLSCTMKSISPWQNGLWLLVLSLASSLSVCPTCICCASGPPSAVFWSSFSASSPSQYHAMMVCCFVAPTSQSQQCCTVSVSSFCMFHKDCGPWLMFLEYVCVYVCVYVLYVCMYVCMYIHT